MIIHHMTLRNFRGVQERKVKFKERGVTILEGPNEAGKSSHIDALNLILDYKSSSKHRDVKAAQPVHRDAGPEVEIEATAGDYRFRYRKRWLKQAITELEIMAPTPENLVGDDAHERVDAILAQTTDLDLWRALRIMQGDSLNEVKLNDAKALGKALDVSAGATPVGDEDTGLLQAIAEEYQQYWTRTGKENKTLKQAEAEVPGLEQELRDAQSSLRAIETDSEQLEALRSELETTRGKGPALEENRRTAAAAWEKAQSAVARHDQARAAYQLARERRDQAASASKRLDQLANKAAEAESLLQQQREKRASSPDLANLREQLKQHQRALDEATNARQQAEAVERLRQADAAKLGDALELERMRERRTAIDQAREQAGQARGIVAASQATDANLAQLRATLDQLATATARLDTAAPHLRVERLGAGKVRVDGRELDSPTAGIDRRVDTETLIEVANHARIVVTPGGDLHAMRKAVKQYQLEAERLLALIGAHDWNTAAEANRLLAKSRAQLDELTRLEQDKLSGSSYDELNARISELEARVEAYRRRRASDPLSDLPMPAGAEEARELLATAQAGADKARVAEQQAQGPLEDARARYQTLEKAQTELDTRIEVLQAQANTSAKDLEEARREYAKAPNSLDDLDISLERTKQDWDKAREAIEHNDPEVARALLDNAKQVCAGHDTRIRELERDLAAIKARIEVHEEDGLFERCQTLETALASARRSAASMRRRAEAVKLAYDILSEERDNARQAYVRPFQAAIERLGRIIYGESFQVEVGEDLSVTRRTLNNRTLEFTQLSAGAREQLGILTRAACAMLVAKDGQIPLILDDTLGNTDEQRMEAMGAVLNLAGRDLQVIILTCVPDRFRNVGSATVIRISSKEG